MTCRPASLPPLSIHPPLGALPIAFAPGPARTHRHEGRSTLRLNLYPDDVLGASGKTKSAGHCPWCLRTQVQQRVAHGGLIAAPDRSAAIGEQAASTRTPAVTSPESPVTLPNSAVAMPKRAVTLARIAQRPMARLSVRPGPRPVTPISSRSLSVSAPIEF